MKELKLRHKESQKKSKSKIEIIEMVTKKVRRSMSRKASTRVSRGMTPKKLNKRESGIEQQAYNPITLAIVNKDQLKDDLAKGVSNKKQFAESFKIKKGPIKVSAPMPRNE
mmetsp:Transcript_17770/g.20541  ORF Transcript_17770/g.20541 Transcript_17770/m.20541 type:complete len:111 (+) Transcript_17770:891-1223(+)